MRRLPLPNPTLVLLATLLAGRAGLAQDIPELDCVIEPSDIVDVGSAAPGVIEELGADRSDVIKKGAVIARLESGVERATLTLSRVRAGLTTAIEFRVENAAFEQRTWERNQALYKQSSISEQELDKLETEARLAGLQVRQEQDNKRIAELEFLRARAALDRRVIHNPVDRVVMERFKSVGEYVEDDAIMRIAQLDPLYVEAIVPVEYLGQIHAGMVAEVIPAVSGQPTRSATVTRVDRVADAASSTFGVRLSLPNPDYQVPGGLRCRLTFMEGGKTPRQHADGVSPEKKAVARPEENGYLLIAERPTDASGTRSFLSKIKQAGVTDFQVLNGGPYKGTVSLGLFQQRDNALQRKARLAAQGLNARLVTR